MKTKKINGKKCLLASLALALFAAVGCLTATAPTQPASAEGALTVSALQGDISATYYTVNGVQNETSKSVIMFDSTVGSPRIGVKVSNYTTGNIDFEMVSNTAVTVSYGVFVDGDPWSWYNGSPIEENKSMTANNSFTQSSSVSLLDKVTKDSIVLSEFYIYFYFKSTADDNIITINKLKVGDVSYAAATYAPLNIVQAPAGNPFKEHVHWTISTGVDKTNNDLTNQEDAAYSNAINNADANLSIAAGTVSATVTVPLASATPLTAWPTSWKNYYIKFSAENVLNVVAHIESVEEGDVNAFCGDILGAWNCKVSLSSTEGYKAACVGLSTYFADYLNKQGNSVSKIVLVITPRDTTKVAKFNIGGMGFGKKNNVPLFINDDPKFEIGTWRGSTGYTISESGSKTVEGTTYTGLKVDWDKNKAGDAYIYADVSNFNKVKTPKLYLGFYTSKDVNISVYAGDANSLLYYSNGGNFTAGYNTKILDLNTVTATAFTLKLYVGHTQTLTDDDTATVVFDSISFYNDTKLGTTLELSEVSTNGVATNIQTSKYGLSWSFDASATGGFYQVNFPVYNWYNFNDRYVTFDLTLSHDTKLAVYLDEIGGSGAGYIHGDSNHLLFAKGSYKFCFDTYRAYTNRALADKAYNKMYFYFDVAVTAPVSFMKTVTVSNIAFSAIAPYVSSPNANVVTVDYAAQTATFEAAYELATAADFAADKKVVSGGAVTPGTTYYVRKAAVGNVAPSAVTTFTLPVASVITYIKTTVTDNSITINKADGYEYKLKDGTGEFKNVGIGNLKPETEYTLLVRKAASETSFASETIEVKVKTLAAPATPDEGSNLGMILGIVFGALVVIGGAVAGVIVYLKKRKKN